MLFALSFCYGMIAAPGMSDVHDDGVVPVILTAGQSNADGRVPIEELPEYIHYDYCQWSYGSGGYVKATGAFKPFAPTVGPTDLGDRWGFDAIVYYLLEQYWQKPFYVIKQTMGGTAIDTSCTNSTNGWFWSVDVLQKSLLKALCRQIDDCLGQLPQNVDIKCLLWHQGEADMTAADRYHDNLKAVVSYIRQHLVEKTGREEYASLPVICGTFAKKSKKYSPEVTEALYQLASEDKDFYVVDASDLTLQRDKVHFDARGAEKLGRRVFKKMRETGIVPDTVPDDTVPDDIVPDDIVPNDTIPDDTVPDDIVPDDTIPDDTVPDDTVPDDTVPDDTVPDDTVPDDTVPDDTVPDDTVPDDTVPDDIVPDNYRPFIEDGKVWKVGTVSGNPVLMVDYYYFDGDTIIEGKTCKQMMSQRYISPDYPDYDHLSQLPTLSKVGAWYEEDKKVYLYDEDKQSMVLMYDFSLADNRILHLVDGYPSFLIGPKQAGGIVGFNGVYRDVMIDQNIKSTTWLEGVGGIDGPIRNAYPETADYVPEFLMSCSVGDEIIYLNDEYEDGATSVNITDEDETQTTGIKAIMNKKEEGQYIYNLKGQRISSLQKGLNIVNGQKIFVK